MKGLESAKCKCVGVALGSGALETLVRRAGCGFAGADCVISPELSGFSYIRLGKQEELITPGIKAAERKLPILQAALADLYWS